MRVFLSFSVLVFVFVFGFVFTKSSYTLFMEERNTSVEN